MVDVEALDEGLAKSAGEALASLRKAGAVDAGVTIDAIVMASAARRGDAVFTSTSRTFRGSAGTSRM
jgi:hypothetical protein